MEFHLFINNLDVISYISDRGTYIDLVYDSEDAEYKWGNGEVFEESFKKGGDFHSRTAIGMYDYIQK